MKQTRTVKFFRQHLNHSCSCFAGWGLGRSGPILELRLIFCCFSLWKVLISVSTRRRRKTTVLLVQWYVSKVRLEIVLASYSVLGHTVSHWKLVSKSEISWPTTYYDYFLHVLMLLAEHKNNNAQAHTMFNTRTDARHCGASLLITKITGSNWSVYTVLMTFSLCRT